MNNSAKRQHHEQTRKKHRQEAQEHAREVAKQPRSKVAMWVLGIGLTLMVLVVIAVLTL